MFVIEWDIPFNINQCYQHADVFDCLQMEACSLSRLVTSVLTQLAHLITDVRMSRSSILLEQVIGGK